jgi:phosphoglycolate phosphatase
MFPDFLASRKASYRLPQPHDPFCGQDTFGVGKPDPRPLIKTIAASGGSSERALMVGESAADIQAARAAGLPVIAVGNGYTDLPVAELAPDRVISHFDQLLEACDALLMA